MKYRTKANFHSIRMELAFVWLYHVHEIKIVRFSVALAYAPHCFLYRYHPGYLLIPVALTVRAHGLPCARWLQYLLRLLALRDIHIRPAPDLRE